MAWTRIRPCAKRDNLEDSVLPKHLVENVTKVPFSLLPLLVYNLGKEGAGKGTEGREERFIFRFESLESRDFFLSGGKVRCIFFFLFSSFSVGFRILSPVLVLLLPPPLSAFNGFARLGGRETPNFEFKVTAQPFPSFYSASHRS